MLGINFGAANEASKAVRHAVIELRGQREQLESTRDSLNEQRESLYLQPLSKAEAKQFLFDYIDAWGNQWLSHGKLDDLFKIISSPRRDQSFAEYHNLSVAHLTLRDVDMVMQEPSLSSKQIFGVSPLPIFGNAFTGMNESYIGGACFFFGDILKSKVGEYFDLRYPETMPAGAVAPVAERRIAIQQLDQQLDELKDGIAQIDLKLRELGAVDPKPLPTGGIRR